jgi:hypothetical protein
MRKKTNFIASIAMIICTIVPIIGMEDEEQDAPTQHSRLPLPDDDIYDLICAIPNRTDAKNLILTSSVMYEIGKFYFVDWDVFSDGGQNYTIKESSLDTWSLQQSRRGYFTIGGRTFNLTDNREILREKCKKDGYICLGTDFLKSDPERMVRLGWGEFEDDGCFFNLYLLIYKVKELLAMNGRGISIFLNRALKDVEYNSAEVDCLFLTQDSKHYNTLYGYLIGRQSEFKDYFELKDLFYVEPLSHRYRSKCYISDLERGIG